MELIHTLLIADRNSPANKWLRENPLVLASGMGVLGLVILYFGVMGLRSGVTRDKYGNQLSGGVATFSSVVRLIFGIGLVCTAIYISIFGAW